MLVLIWKHVLPVAALSLAGLYLKAKLLPQMGNRDALVVTAAVIAYLLLWHLGVFEGTMAVWFSGDQALGRFYNVVFACGAGCLVLEAIKAERR